MALATAVARRYLEQARESGDPRFAGLALAALRALARRERRARRGAAAARDAEQYLHEFDAAVGAPAPAARAARRSERQSQAWLTLATVLRVQGRYAESDDACRRVAAAGAELHAGACLAENAALRGEVAAARRSFETLLAGARPAGGDARLAD